MTSIDFGDVQALMRMTSQRDDVTANLARAALVILEALRDAEVRAASAEAALATERAKLESIRDALGPAIKEGRLDPGDALLHIARLATL